MDSLAKLQQLHPALRDVAIAAYNEAVAATPAGVHPVIDQALRSFEESAKLYAQGRTTPGSIVSNAKAGQSWHNYGLAIDFHLVIDGKDVWPNEPAKDANWMIVVNTFKKHGFNWGGDWQSFKDYPHLERKMGYDLNTLFQKWKNNDTFIDKNGQTYVNL